MVEVGTRGASADLDSGDTQCDLAIGGSEDPAVRCIRHSGNELRTRMDWIMRRWSLQGGMGRRYSRHSVPISSPAGQVRTTLRRRLQESSWTYHGNPALQAFVDHEPVAWTAPIRGGVNAGMDVFSPSKQDYPGAWELQLSAPPVAPVGECQGG